MPKGPTTTPPFGRPSPATAGTTGVVTAGPVVLAAVVVVAGWGYLPADWTILHGAGRDLLAGHLTVYVRHPDAQVGPLALVLSALPRPLFTALVCALMLSLTLTGRRLGIPDRAILVGGSVAAIPWGVQALGGHIDDPLVVTGAAVMILGLRQHRPDKVGWGFVLALAGKPTGVVLAPLLLTAGWPAIGVAVAGVATVWGPFVLADLGGFLRAGQGVVWVEPWSLPFVLGEPAGAAFPEWVRPVQLVGGLAGCWLVARRNGPVSAAVAALAFRAVLEPGAWPSYSVCVIALTLLLPTRRGQSTSLAAFSWLVGWLLIAQPNAVTGVLHAGLLMALILLSIHRSPVPALATQDALEERLTSSR